MRSLFIVLSDDEFRAKMSKIKPTQSSTESGQLQGAGDSPPDSGSSGSGPKTGSKGKFGSKPSGSGSGGKSGSSGSKNLKRTADSDTSLESNPPKK